MSDALLDRFAAALDYPLQPWQRQVLADWLNRPVLLMPRRWGWGWAVVPHDALYFLGTITTPTADNGHLLARSRKRRRGR